MRSEVSAVLRVVVLDCDGTLSRDDAFDLVNTQPAFNQLSFQCHFLSKAAVLAKLFGKRRDHPSRGAAKNQEHDPIIQKQRDGSFHWLTTLQKPLVGLACTVNSG